MMDFAWVIERADSPVSAPLYHSLTPGHGQFWEANHLMAIRFARAQDAHEYASFWLSDDDYGVRICEHGWGRYGGRMTIDDQIKSVKREIAMRRTVYPKRVAEGKMKGADAGHEIVAMEAVLQTLLKVKDMAKRAGRLL